MIRSVAILGVLIGLVGSADADWPNYGGPDHNNISSETGLMQAWPADGPEVLWSLPLGVGFGGPAIRDGQVFLLDRKGEEQDVLRVLDLNTGRELWSYAYDAPGKTGYPGSRAVPTVTDRYVFTVGPFGHLHCIDRQSKQPLWSTNIIGENPGRLPWGIAQSPLATGSMVITSGPGMPGMTAYNQEDGKVLWQTKSIPGMPFASPVPHNLAGQAQLVMVSSRGVSGVDPATGRELWNFANYKCNIPIPHPTLIGENRLFVTGGYRAGSVMIEITPDGDGFAATEVWRISQGAQIHQPIYIDGAIYLNGNTNDTPRQGLTCVNPDNGEILWASAEPALDRGNFIYADGRFYAMGATGTLHLIEPSREEMKVVSSTDQLKPKEIWAPLALSEGILVIRDQREMKALKVAK